MAAADINETLVDMSDLYLTEGTQTDEVMLSEKPAQTQSGGLQCEDVQSLQCEDSAGAHVQCERSADVHVGSLQYLHSPIFTSAVVNSVNSLLLLVEEQVSEISTRASRAAERALTSG